MNVVKFPDENMYGHTKKLIFIKKQINNFLDSCQHNINVLDFGCGNGSAVTQYLRDDRIKLYGLDIHPESLNYAAEHFTNKNTFFINKVPTDILFDIIIYSDVLEHVIDPLNIIKSQSKYLKKNGMIICSVPNGYGPFEIESKLDHYFHLTEFTRNIIRIKNNFFGIKADYIKSEIVKEIPYNIKSGHIQCFTKRSFLSLLQRAGYRVITFNKGAFLGAPFSIEFFLNRPSIIKINAKIADYLPIFAVSMWYLTAKKDIFTDNNK